jgi:hypothetical protein
MSVFEFILYTSREDCKKELSETGDFYVIDDNIQSTATSAGNSLSPYSAFLNGGFLCGFLQTFILLLKVFNHGLILAFGSRPDKFPDLSISCTV